LSPAAGSSAAPGAADGTGAGAVDGRDYGIDTERVQAPRSLLEMARSRISGRYLVDPFGGDPQLQDFLSPPLLPLVRADVGRPRNLPRRGPALLVANRGVGLAEPLVLALAVRRVAGRRLRVIGAPDLPVLGDLVRKLGAVGAYPADLRAVLRAGHLAAVPLGPTWLRTGAGIPPLGLIAAAVGFPVIQVAIRPGGPLGLPLRPWKVRFGRPLELDARDLHDPLAPAELAEAAREAIEALLGTG